VADAPGDASPPPKPVLPATRPTPPALPERLVVLLTPDERADLAMPPTFAGLRLLAVDRERLPLQLVGYVKGPGGPIATFTDTRTRRAHSVAAGDVVPGTTWRFKALVLREHEGTADSAVVEEVDSGRMIEVGDEAPETGRLVATLRLGGVELRVAQGDTVPHPVGELHVGAVEAEPPAVLVEAADGETLRLEPR
jgi:hypothetical protein